MTVAEKLRKEGKKEGKIEGFIEMTSNLLRIKFRKEAEPWMPLLPQYTGASLKKIGERIFLEDSLEKVFQGLEKK